MTDSAPGCCWPQSLLSAWLHGSRAVPRRPMIMTPARARVAVSPLAATVRRGTTVERGYDQAWKRVRADHLRLEPLCRHCRREKPPRLTPAREVDHIVDIIDAPHLRLEHSNLQSLCKPHHSRKTRLTMNERLKDGRGTA